MVSNYPLFRTTLLTPRPTPAPAPLTELCGTPSGDVGHLPDQTLSAVIQTERPDVLAELHLPVQLQQRQVVVDQRVAVLRVLDNLLDDVLLRRAVGGRGQVQVAESDHLRSAAKQAVSRRQHVALRDQHRPARPAVVSWRVLSGLLRGGPVCLEDVLSGEARRRVAGPHALLILAPDGLEGLLLVRSRTGDVRGLRGATVAPLGGRSEN